MKKTIIPAVLIFSASIFAQPYIYYTTSTQDTIFSFTKLPDGKEKLDPYGVTTTAHQKRFDLKNNSDEDFPPGENLSKDYSTPVWDPGQTYIDYFTYGRNNTIYQCAKPSNSFFFEDSTSIPVNELLYSALMNMLYVFYDDYQILSVVDLSSNKIISQLKIPGYADNNPLMFPNRDTFFSSDDSKIYFYICTAGLRTDQVWTYSLSKNEILDRRNLSDLGYPGSEGYSLTFGREGKGIIYSYSSKPSAISYYRIYDFDAEKGSEFIKYEDGFSEAYFNSNEKFLLIFDTFYDTTAYDYYHTGKVLIYDSGNGKLVNTLGLPAHGIVYTFDNYPDDLYYVVNIDSPQRQIFRINADRLLNK